MTCEQCKNLTVEQIRDMSTEQLIDAYRQGYAIKDLEPLCTSSPVSVGQTINVNAAPMGGIVPYTVKFYKKLNTSDKVQIGTIQTNVPEATSSTIPSTTTSPYIVTNGDRIGATGDPGATPPLPPGYIRIITEITDSCTVSSGGPKICTEYCDVIITCVSQTCNIIVEIVP
jgi:hypothetical protein